MIRRIILGALLVLSIPALAQKSPVKGIPKECRTVKPTYSSLRNTSMALDYFSSKEFIQEDAPSLGYWDVYSDRDNNTTYRRKKENGIKTDIKTLLYVKQHFSAYLRFRQKNQISSRQ